MGSETSPSLRCKQHIYFMGSETSPSLRIYFMGSETSPSLRFTLWGRKRLLHCVANFDLNQYTLSKGIQIFDLRTKVGLCKGINISYTSHRYDLGATTSASQYRKCRSSNQRPQYFVPYRCRQALKFSIKVFVGSKRTGRHKLLLFYCSLKMYPFCEQCH